MSQRQQMERVRHIDRLIRNGEFPSVDRLTQELECGRRAIFMDRQFMRDRLGAPIGHSRKRGGWYYTEATYTLPAIPLTESELLAFALGVEATRHNLGAGLEAPLQSAVGKIEESLRGPVPFNWQSLLSHCSFSRPSALQPAAGVVPAICDALQRQQRLRMTYLSGEKKELTEREVDPYELHHAEGEWYLLAFDHLRRAMRTFHCGRIEDCSVQPRRYERNPQFDVAEWRKCLFVAESSDEPTEVVIRFDAYQAAHIRERRWHDTQQIEEMPDGQLILKFRTGGWGDVVRFVLQYGAHAEVLAPPELRREVAGQARLMIKRYGK